MWHDTATADTADAWYWGGVGRIRVTRWGGGEGPNRHILQVLCKSGTFERAINVIQFLKQFATEWDVWHVGNISDNDNEHKHNARHFHRVDQRLKMLELLKSCQQVAEMKAMHCYAHCCKICRGGFQNWPLIIPCLFHCFTHCPEISSEIHSMVISMDWTMHWKMVTLNDPNG